MVIVFKEIKGTMIKFTMTILMLIGYVRIVSKVYRQFFEVHLDAYVVTVVEVKHTL